jgi:hypothetical protein
MSENRKLDELASSLTEEVLRKIYGDDFKGCTVNPNDIAQVIHDGLATNRTQARELIELYEKVVEAVHLLSTPPDGTSVTDPNELRSLLSQRLDAIHAITTRTMQTTSRARNQPG